MPGPIPRLVIRVKLRKNRETNDEEARPKRFDASPACPFNRSLYRLSLKRAYRARFLIGDSSLYLSVSRMPPPDKHITRVRRVPGKTQNEKKKNTRDKSGTRYSTKEDVVRTGAFPGAAVATVVIHHGFVT